MRRLIMACMHVSSLLQYPIGRYSEPQTFSVADRSAAIETLASFPAQLCEALLGLQEAQLDVSYRPGSWTVRQLVHHLADSHMSAYLAVRQALTNEWPVVMAYDADAWTALPDAWQVSVACSLKILEGVHQRWVAVMGVMAEEDWARRGYRHSEGGPCALERVPMMYAWHSRHHLAHIVNCRKRHNW